MNREQTLKEISEIVSMQNTAIKSHDKKLISLYDNTKDVLISGQRTNWDSENGEPLILSNTEIEEVNKYITSSSFISAWYALMGDAKKRDVATHSCVTLISGLGLKSDEVMHKYLQTETLWRVQMKKIGVASFKMKNLIIVAVLLLSIYFLFRR